MKVNGFQIIAFFIVLLCINAIITFKLRPEPKVEYYSDEVLLEQFQLWHAAMQQEIMQNNYYIDSLTKIVSKSNAEIKSHLNGISKLKKRIYELEENYDNSYFTNDSLLQSITNNLNKGSSRTN